MPALIFHQGHPLMVDYTPSGAVAAGDVVVISGRPYVAHNAIAANTLGALAMEGGVYKGIAAGNYAPGQKVYWNASTGKITTAVGSHPHFGWIVPSSDPGADEDPVVVLHAPDGTATASE
jgi:predicted RecA/RadA family phage recombinase